MYYIINIGSNLGDPRLNLSRAMRSVGMEFGDFEMSHVVETAPWGFESKYQFLNIAMMFQSDLTPEDVLKKLQAIEKSISPDSHRTPAGQYTDRLIDIDLVAADDLIINTPNLTLPHPHLAERDFFLVPLEEIAPGWRHPSTGLTATQMLEKLRAD